MNPFTRLSPRISQPSQRLLLQFKTATILDGCLFAFEIPQAESQLALWAANGAPDISLFHTSVNGCDLGR